MKNNNIKVSIGMPVYNGDDFIRQALDSLLGQEFEDFELIISDNASIDNTQMICLEYATRDKRIRYYRNDMNRGAAYNFLRVFELSRGEFFMWSSHDDVWMPTFISELVNMIENVPSAVMAVCRAEKIDHNEGRHMAFSPLYLNTTGMTRPERLSYSAQYVSGWLLHALYRKKMIQTAVDIFQEKKFSIGAPEVLFLHRCLDKGDLLFSDKLLFKKRQTSEKAQENPEQSINIYKMLVVMFLYCYGSFFKCFNLKGLRLSKVAKIYWAVLKGLPQRSFFQHIVKALRKNPIISLFDL